MANFVPSLDCRRTVTETIFCSESIRAISKLLMSVAGSAVTLDVGLAVGLAVISAGNGAAWPSPRRKNTPVSNATAKIELINHFRNDGIRFTLDTDLDLKCIG
jgi:hypothetical protein